jgi:glycyl-tRNA synthetase
LKRKFFYTPSFEIYGGCAGFYDFGPLGSALKANVEALWRNHFILEEDMLELNCTCLTIDKVLQTSVSYFQNISFNNILKGSCCKICRLYG